MVSSRGFVVLAVFGLGSIAPASAHAARVVYLNADPTLLNSNNGQDPTTNSFMSTGFTPGMISGWPALTDAQKQDLVFRMKEASLPFDITYTWERPLMGTYDMIVMGTNTDSNALFAQCSPAISLQDCDDGNGPNIGFLFWGCMTMAQQSDMNRVAFNVFASLGFGWGLENLSVSGQIMGNYTQSALQYGNSCADLSGMSACTHIGCGAGLMNSTADLDARIGMRVDDGPPVVAITSPGDLEIVDANVVVDADVTDAFGGLEVALEVVEAGDSSIDDVPPYSWGGIVLPMGQWTLRVNVTDADGNLSSDEVQVCVGLDECMGAATTGGESSSGGGGDVSSGGAVDDSTGNGGGEVSSGSDSGGGDGSGEGGIDPTNATSPLSGGFGGSGTPETGCGCSGGGAKSSGWLPALALFARRRRATRTT